MLPDPGGLFQQSAGSVVRLNAVFRAVDEVRNDESLTQSEKEEAKKKLDKRVGKA